MANQDELKRADASERAADDGVKRNLSDLYRYLEGVSWTMYGVQ